MTKWQIYEDDNESQFKTQFKDESWPLPFYPVQIVYDCVNLQRWNRALINVFSSAPLLLTPTKYQASTKASVNGISLQAHTHICEFLTFFLHNNESNDFSMWIINVFYQLHFIFKYILLRFQNDSHNMNKRETVVKINLYKCSVKILELFCRIGNNGKLTVKYKSRLWIVNTQFFYGEGIKITTK